MLQKIPTPTLKQVILTKSMSHKTKSGTKQVRGGKISGKKVVNWRGLMVSNKNQTVRNYHKRKIRGNKRGKICELTRKPNDFSL